MMPERCPKCGRLLLMVNIIDGEIEIKCKCGELVTRTYRPRPARVRTNEYGLGIEVLDTLEPSNGRPPVSENNRKRSWR